LNAPFEKDGHEYGNYEKYESNSVEHEEEDALRDDGESKFFKNYQNMLRSLDIEEGDLPKNIDRGSIQKTVENY